MKKIFSLLLIIPFYLFLFTSPIHAQIVNKLQKAHTDNVKNIPFNTDIAGLFTGGKLNLLELLFFFVGIIFFFSLIFASYSYITASGSPQNIQAATKRITNSLLGLGVVVTSYLAIRIIGTMIGMPGII